MNNETDQRIYVGECGCVRVESKHVRVTMQPEQFVAMLQEIALKEKRKPMFCNRLTISNNVRSNGFVSIENRPKRRKL
jgi:hypothetical protein